MSAIIELADCTRVLLDEIADRHFTRKSVAKTYRMALASSWDTDWERINLAIINRWSLSGLEFIKRLAWK